MFIGNLSISAIRPVIGRKRVSICVSVRMLAQAPVCVIVCLGILGERRVLYEYCFVYD